MLETVSACGSGFYLDERHFEPRHRALSVFEMNFVPDEHHSCCRHEAASAFEMSSDPCDGCLSHHHLSSLMQLPRQTKLHFRSEPVPSVLESLATIAAELYALRDAAFYPDVLVHDAKLLQLIVACFHTIVDIAERHNDSVAAPLATTAAASSAVVEA